MPGILADDKLYKKMITDIYLFFWLANCFKETSNCIISYPCFAGNGEFSDKLRKYFALRVGATNKEFSISWIYGGQTAALN